MGKKNALGRINGFLHVKYDMFCEVHLEHQSMH